MQNEKFLVLYVWVFLFLLSMKGSLLFSQNQDDQLLNAHDLTFMEQNSSQQFVYMPDEMFNVISVVYEDFPILMKDIQAQRQLSTHLIPLEMAKKIILQLDDCFNNSTKQNEALFQGAKILFQEYKKLLDSGEAVIDYEALTRSKKRRVFDDLLVRCRLIAATLKVCGDIRVCGNVIKADGTILGATGPTGPTGATGPTGVTATSEFLWIYSTALQSSSGAPVQIFFNGLGASNGFSFTPIGSVITIPSTGTYLINFDANADQTTVAITVRRNLSTVIAGSGSFTSQGDGIVGQSGTLIASFTAGDSVDFLLDSGSGSPGSITRSISIANTHSITVTIVRLT